MESKAKLISYCRKQTQKLNNRYASVLPKGVEDEDDHGEDHEDNDDGHQIEYPEEEMEPEAEQDEGNDEGEGETAIDEDRRMTIFVKD